MKQGVQTPLTSHRDFDYDHPTTLGGFLMRPLLYLVLAVAAFPLAASSARAEAAAEETVYIVSYVDVAPATTARNQTAALLRQIAETSRRDQGNLRFEVLQRTVPANQFMILEIW